jgi:hypothetical protein
MFSFVDQKGSFTISAIKIKTRRRKKMKKRERTKGEREKVNEILKVKKAK